MKKVTTNLPLNYITIKTTKSRIEKGLLAIPVSALKSDRNFVGYDVSQEYIKLANNRLRFLLTQEKLF